MKRILCLSIYVLLASVAVFADIARPDPTKTPKPAKSVEGSMTIHLYKDLKQAKLVIPKSQIKKLRAQLDQLDDDADNTAAVTAPASFSRTQTVVSGTFLSLALVFGGMWFARSGKSATKAGKSLVILAILAGVGSAVTMVYANAGPPPGHRSITSKMFSVDTNAYGYGFGKITLETSDVDGPVDFQVPKLDENAKSDD